MDRGFQRGAVAAGMVIELTPAATPWEILEVYRVAAKYGAAEHVHMRGLSEAQYFLETEEVIAATAATGAATHMVHIQSSLGEDTPRGLELVRGARARGLDITTEVYPYTASMSHIEGADTDDWRTWSDKKFQRFEWALTGEKLTRESFARYRAIGGYIVEYNNPESVVTDAVADSLTMIASDGILHGGMGHPRVAGTFARVLGRYARDLKTVTLNAIVVSVREPQDSARVHYRSLPLDSLNSRKEWRDITDVFRLHQNIFWTEVRQHAGAALGPKRRYHNAGDSVLAARFTSTVNSFR